MQRNRPIFGGAIKKLFKSVSEGYSISQKSLAIVEDFTKDIINRICEELGNLADYKRPKIVDKRQKKDKNKVLRTRAGKTLGLSEVMAAVKLLLPVNVLQDMMPHMEAAIAEFEKTKNLKSWQ